uniref:LIM zinc-binding domain-containing protein n=1 Tax=Eptatretus burgeri TaxID=7764 RepID=A0A8C4R8X2_EPTBU
MLGPQPTGNHLENGEGTDKKDVHRERNLQLHRQKGSEQDDYEEMNMSMDSTQDRDMPFRSQTDTMEDRVPRLEHRRTSGGAGDAVQDQRGDQVSPETKARPWTRISSTPTESHGFQQARDPLVRQHPTGLLAQRLLEDATSRRVSDLKSTPVSMEPRSAELRSHREKDRQSAALQKSHRNTERESLVGHQSLVKVESSSAVQQRNKVIQEMRKAVAVQRDSSWIRINELAGKGLSYHSKRSTMHADDQSWIQCRSEMSPKERPRSLAVELSNLHLNSEDMGLRRTNSSDNLDMIHPRSPEPSPGRVAGRKECCACKEPIGRGAAMFIESLKAFFHLDCFKCGVCHKVLSKSGSSIDVRLQQGILHCKDCYDNSMDVAHSFLQTGPAWINYFLLTFSSFLLSLPPGSIGTKEEWVHEN